MDIQLKEHRGTFKIVDRNSEIKENCIASFDPN